MRRPVRSSAGADRGEGGHLGSGRETPERSQQDRNIAAPARSLKLWFLLDPLFLVAVEQIFKKKI